MITQAQLEEMSDEDFNKLFNSSVIVREPVVNVKRLVSFFLIFTLSLANWVLYNVNLQLLAS